VSRPVHILFVCIGNITRSPTAEAAIRQAGSRVGLDLEVRSAGVAARPGQPPNARMAALAAEREINIQHAARQVGQSDLEWADRILAMDRYTRDRLLEIDGRAHVEMFALLDPDAGGNDEVLDPGGGDDNEFLIAMGTIERAGAALIASLLRTGSAFESE